MTGFFQAEGQHTGLAWVWELRSVNGRGLDLRFRLPPGWDALESELRESAGKTLRRGNVAIGLTLGRDSAPRMAVDPAALEQVLALALELHRRIPDSPVPRAEALLALPGVMRQTTRDPGEDREQAGPAVRASFETALAGLVMSRQQEGGRLRDILTSVLNEIASLRATAERQATDQPARHRQRMLEAVRTLLSETPALPEERIAQEVALLATKSDVREELDRLKSHIAAAHALLAEGVAVGRRLDFLVQEFNREVNTLCSKSASPDLTATGLKLKAAIEQLREQAQNVE
jgi:uncharacterized protein (TIGR00255 family)